MRAIMLRYKQIFTTPAREEIYRDWYRINQGGTLRQFRVYLVAYEMTLKKGGK